MRDGDGCLEPAVAGRRARACRHGAARADREHLGRAEAAHEQVRSMDDDVAEIVVEREAPRLGTADGRQRDQLTARARDVQEARRRVVRKPSRRGADRAPFRDRARARVDRDDGAAATEGDVDDSGRALDDAPGLVMRPERDVEGHVPGDEVGDVLRGPRSGSDADGELARPREHRQGGSPLSGGGGLPGSAVTPKLVRRNGSPSEPADRRGRHRPALGADARGLWMVWPRRERHWRVAIAWCRRC